MVDIAEQLRGLFVKEVATMSVVIEMFPFLSNSGSKWSVGQEVKWKGCRIVREDLQALRLFAWLTKFLFCGSFVRQTERD